MGAGKTAVGRQLSRLLHHQFIDSDEEIESRTGVDIPFIFEKEGEDGFRDREEKVIEELDYICSKLDNLSPKDAHDSLYRLKSLREDL